MWIVQGYGILVGGQIVDVYCFFVQMLCQMIEQMLFEEGGIYQIEVVFGQLDYGEFKFDLVLLVEYVGEGNVVDFFWQFVGYKLIEIYFCVWFGQFDFGEGGDIYNIGCFVYGFYFFVDDVMLFWLIEGVVVFLFQVVCCELVWLFVVVDFFVDCVFVFELVIEWVWFDWLFFQVVEMWEWDFMVQVVVFFGFDYLLVFVCVVVELVWIEFVYGNVG